MRLSENRSDKSVKRADVDGDDVELFGAIHFDRVAEQAEARIVDDEFDLGAFGSQRGRYPIARIGASEIAGNDNRRGAAGAGDFRRQRGQAGGPPRDECDAMAVRCENARQFGANASRGTGNQRHTLGHDSMLLSSMADQKYGSGRNESIRLRWDASLLQSYDVFKCRGVEL